MVDVILIGIVIILSLLIGAEIGKYCAWDEAYEEAVDDILDELRKVEIDRQFRQMIEKYVGAEDEE